MTTAQLQAEAPATEYHVIARSRKATWQSPAGLWLFQLLRQEIATAFGLSIFTCKPTTMNEITDCRGWRPRHPVRRQAAVRYAEKSAHRGPIFPKSRRGRRPLQRRSYRTMTVVIVSWQQPIKLGNHPAWSAEACRPPYRTKHEQQRQAFRLPLLCVISYL